MVEREIAQWSRQNLKGESGDKEYPRGKEFPLKVFLREGPGQQRQGSAAGDGDERLSPPPLLEQRQQQQEPLPELMREKVLPRLVTANTGNMPLLYAQLQLLMRQGNERGRIWSLSVEGDFSLRRVGYSAKSSRPRPRLIFPFSRCTGGAISKPESKVASKRETIHNGGGFRPCRFGLHDIRCTK